MVCGERRSASFCLQQGGFEKTNCQDWPFDQSSTEHRHYEEKQQAIYIPQVLLNTPTSLPLCVCMWRDEARTGADVIVNWIKLKKDLFKREREKKNTNNRQKECVAGGRRGVTGK